MPLEIGSPPQLTPFFWSLCAAGQTWVASQPWALILSYHPQRILMMMVVVMMMMIVIGHVCVQLRLHLRLTLSYRNHPPTPHRHHHGHHHQHHHCHRHHGQLSAVINYRKVPHGVVDLFCTEWFQYQVLHLLQKSVGQCMQMVARFHIIAQC